MTMQDPDIWKGAYKLPWDEPAFSGRMLAEHLAQHRDMASRRSGWIDRQVEWIHNDLLKGRAARVLDLGCGPGFYAARLTERGHRCCGIDFSPASIDHARRHTPDATRCTFVQGDIRAVAFAGPYDLAMILYGELNVFSPTEALAILRKARTALEPDGLVICELQTPEAIESVGRGASSGEHSEAGLFSARPHRCRTDNQWLPEQRVAIQTFTVTEDGEARPRVYRSTTKAWADDELKTLLRDAGFKAVVRSDEWPCNTDSLTLWIAACA
jgi:SAM-dependent methyltransferase